MVHKDVLSIRQKSPLQAHLAGNMGNGDRSEDDNSDGPGDTTGYRMPSPENSEQNVQGRPRKRKHSVSRMESLPTQETNGLCCPLLILT